MGCELDFVGWIGEVWLDRENRISDLRKGRVWTKVGIRLFVEGVLDCGMSGKFSEDLGYCYCVERY